MLKLKDKMNEMIKINQKKLLKIIKLITPAIILIFFLFVIFVPLTKAGIIPECEKKIDIGGEYVCDWGWNDIINLIKNIINFVIYNLALPIFVAVFMYAGYLFLSSGEKEEQRKRAKKIFVKALTGLVLTLSAWLIVNTILNFFIPKEKVGEYSLLKEIEETNNSSQP